MKRHSQRAEIGFVKGGSRTGEPAELRMERKPARNAQCARRMDDGHGAQIRGVMSIRS